MIMIYDKKIKISMKHERGSKYVTLYTILLDYIRHIVRRIYSNVMRLSSFLHESSISMKFKKKKILNKRKY